MPIQWVDDDPPLECAPNATEDFSSYWYGDVVEDDNGQKYVRYDAGQTPTTIYPPSPPKVRPPSGPPCTRPPSAPSTNPPNAPRVRRTKDTTTYPLPY